MNSHRFRVGQWSTSFGRRGAPRPPNAHTGSCGSSPIMGCEQLYRIKTITEALARVAKESELVFEIRGEWPAPAILRAVKRSLPNLMTRMDERKMITSSNG